jgi:transmembrane sensor
MDQDEMIGGRDDQAVSWFVRLQDCDDEAVWQAHVAWLEADPANAASYAAVEQAWIDVEAPSIEGVDRDEPADVVDLAEHRSARRRGGFWFPAAAAAALVAIVTGSQSLHLGKPAGETYRTDGTAGREIALNDGSRLTLGRDTELTVDLDGNRRNVSIASGQAAFDVRHDATRPFVIAAGDREVRVLGTEFDVMTRGETFGVSVRRGLVSVSDKDAPSAVTRLPAGKALLRLPGTDRDQITSVDPDNALAWRDGRLIYIDSTLANVALDYQRYVGKPVVVARDVRDLHISGVVNARNEEDLIRQLELLLPVRITRTPEGRQITKR